MSSCGVEWSGAVWWETSAPLLLQNPLITWFCLCVAFFISQQFKKKQNRNTRTLSKWQQRKYNYRKRIHHQPCPKPTVACAACETDCEDEPVEGSVLSTITTEPWYLHSTFFRFLLSLHCPSQTCHIGVRKHYPESPWTLIISAEVEAKSCEAAGLVRVWLWAGWQSFWFAGYWSGLGPDMRWQTWGCNETTQHFSALTGRLLHCVPAASL